ncbi:hypothetical protein PVAP13_8NG156704 [Panicum virgatum]|uniref:Uncharacterized protein n=1 Tax=Panicum virgatum TaxID=38727 RepID=A0A8T0P846_PANVG|nr:hypothetical protein PVAP13_8NG156704 [Panicum virgatum]
MHHTIGAAFWRVSSRPPRRSLVREESEARRELGPEDVAKYVKLTTSRQKMVTATTQNLHLPFCIFCSRTLLLFCSRGSLAFICRVLVARVSVLSSYGAL